MYLKLHDETTEAVLVNMDRISHVDPTTDGGAMLYGEFSMYVTESIEEIDALLGGDATREFGTIHRMNYSESSDSTFITRESYDLNGELVSTEVVGWHFGEPNTNSHNFIGRMKAEY